MNEQIPTYHATGHKIKKCAATQGEGMARRKRAERSGFALIFFATFFYQEKKVGTRLAQPQKAKSRKKGVRQKVEGVRKEKVDGKGGKAEGIRFKQARGKDVRLQGVRRFCRIINC